MASTRRNVLLSLGAGVCAAMVAGCSKDSTKAEPVNLEVTIKDGKTTPSGARIQVAKGAEVTVTINSDVKTLVHVHGYEREIEAEPGKPGKDTFKADLVGSFEVETHDPSKIIANLVVK